MYARLTAEHDTAVSAATRDLFRAMERGNAQAIEKAAKDLSHLRHITRQDLWERTKLGRV